MRRHMVAADDLREEYERRKGVGQVPRAGWKDAIRFLEEMSTAAPAGAEREVRKQHATPEWDSES